MSLGLTTLTVVHVAIILVGIVSGLVVVFGLLRSKRLDGWTGLFLVTTVATSVTGFFFPSHGFTPGDAFGIVSLVVLAVAILALYRRHLAGGWRRTYVISAVVALYLNVFVLIAQFFEKVPTLKALAPTLSEPPFKATQVVVLVLFIVLGIAAVKRFRGDQPAQVREQMSRAA